MHFSRFSFLSVITILVHSKQFSWVTYTFEVIFNHTFPLALQSHLLFNIYLVVLVINTSLIQRALCYMFLIDILV